MKGYNGQHERLYGKTLMSPLLTGINSLLLLHRREGCQIAIESIWETMFFVTIMLNISGLLIHYKALHPLPSLVENL